MAIPRPEFDEAVKNAHRQHGGGRPKLQPHEKRSARLPAARVTEAELDHIAEQAANADLSLTDYIRTLALTEEVKPRRSKLESSLLTELNRIGVNLNQVAHAANIGRTDEAKLSYIMDELFSLMKRVDGALS